MRAPRQLLLAEMQAAQAALTRTRPPSDTAIHAARQHVKRARAILRLLRTAVGLRVYRQLNRELRDCNRALRAARDSAVVMETLRSLGVRKPYLKPAISGVEAYWRKHRGDGHALASPTRDSRAALTDLATAAAAVRGSRSTRSFDTATPSAIQLSYRKARRAYLRALRRPSDAAWHECRKQTKYLYYQLQIANERRRERPDVILQASELASMLGKERDLALLAAELRRSGVDRRAAGSAVLLYIKQRRRRLQHRSVACARQLFRHKASVFARRQLVKSRQRETAP